MRHAVLILSLALAAGPGFAADPPADEPVHGGKKLSEWVKQLEDKDPTARADAGRAIGIMGPQAKAAVPALIKALKDPEPSVRDWACYGLSNIGPHAKDAVPALEDLLLHDKTMKVRRIAANALGSIGPAAKPAVPSLIKTLQDDDPWMRHFAAVTLGALGESAKDAVPELIKAFGDEEYVVQKSAVEAVGQIGPKAKEAVPALLKVWRDPGEYEKTRKAAAKLSLLSRGGLPGGEGRHGLAGLDGADLGCGARPDRADRLALLRPVFRQEHEGDHGRAHQKHRAGGDGTPHQRLALPRPARARPGPVVLVVLVVLVMPGAWRRWRLVLVVLAAATNRLLGGLLPRRRLFVLPGGQGRQRVLLDEGCRGREFVRRLVGVLGLLFAQRFEQGRRRLVALLRPLRQQAPEHPAQLVGNVAGQGAEVRLAAAAAGAQEPERGAEGGDGRPHVAGGVVARGPEQAKIEEFDGDPPLDIGAARHAKVGRRQVARHQPLALQQGQRPRGLHEDATRRVAPERPVALDVLGETFAFDRLHRQVPCAAGLAEVQHADDVAGAHPGGPLGLAPEAVAGGGVAGQLGGEHLEDDRAAGVDVGRAVGGAETTKGHRRLDLVRSDAEAAARSLGGWLGGHRADPRGRGGRGYGGVGKVRDYSRRHGPASTRRAWSFAPAAAKPLSLLKAPLYRQPARLAGLLRLNG
jgi:hypothetical protein